MRSVAAVLILASVLSVCAAKPGHFQAVLEPTNFIDPNGEPISAAEAWSDLATEVSFKRRDEDFATVTDLLLEVSRDIRSKDITERDEDRITEHFGAQNIDITSPRFFVFSERKIAAAVSKLQQDINLPQSVADDLEQVIQACEDRHRLDYISYQARQSGLQTVALVAFTCTDRENIQLFWSLAQYTTALTGKEFSSTFREVDTADRFRSILIRNMIKPAVPCKKSN